jgi:hypothetical protein
MPIETKCPGCARLLRVADEHAGRQARCPECNTIYIVPSATDPAQVPPSPETGGWYLKTPERQVYGPVSRPELDRWLAEGRITAECELRAGEAAAWQTADRYYPILRPAPAAAPAPAARPGTATAEPLGPAFSGTGGASREYAAGHAGIPHRGGLILAFGIVGWVFTCPLFAVMAWVMGSSDLREMRYGRMDPSGMGLTQAGSILGMIYTLLWLGVMVIGMFLLLLLGVASAAS